MIEFTHESHNNILVAKISGKVTVADYQNIVIPKLESLLASHSKISLLAELSPDFKGWDLKAIVIAIKYAFVHRKNIGKRAIVGSASGVARLYLAGLLTLNRCLIGPEIRTFAITERNQALEWINAS